MPNLTQVSPTAAVTSDKALMALIKDMDSRIKKLERPMRLGIAAQWVIEVDALGQLIVKHFPSGSTTIIAVP